MPPPMIATFIREPSWLLPSCTGCLQPGARHRNHGCREFRRVIERLRAIKRHAPGSGVVLKSDIDVIQDLHVIADKTYGLHEDGFMSFGGESVNGTLDGGADPSAARHSLTLETELPLTD